MFDLFWFITALLLLLGCAIQTALGFGIAVIAAPIIVIFRPDWIPAILTITAFSLTIGNAWNLRHEVNWQQMSVPMISRIPGTLIGTWLLTQMAHQTLQLMVAGMVFFAVIATAFAKPFKANTVNLSIAGLVSGFTGSTTAIGGPPMALVMQHGSGNQTRASLSLYFAYASGLSLISLQLMGIMTTELWLIGLSFIPFVIVGYFLGVRLRGWVDSKFRSLLLIMCSVSAVIAIYGAISP
ncbi:sulfite exporter TauE/SafE family protein [Reinekea thalattae]|uniref:Probable membrane transporter protein n=1 Tax=Reinekea thalattae TaxID=2593301 RepID=A0A5C8Z722_9GAMM|nr:sulfite exporter TauE/SafE family protein [Reinekea thalattae]TXR53895.1 sulfite exporter TauE/SafE family protein [Reinekea thalattae]